MIVEFYKVLAIPFIPLFILVIIIQLVTAGKRYDDIRVKDIERQNRLKRAKLERDTHDKKAYIKKSQLDLEYHYYENGQAYKEFNKKHK